MTSEQKWLILWCFNRETRRAWDTKRNEKGEGERETEKVKEENIEENVKKKIMTVTAVVARF